MPRCAVKRCGGHPCGGSLEPHIDTLGRVHFDCPRCARRLAGICADCPRPVEGTVGKAERCASCRVVELRAAALRHRHRNIEQVRRYQRVALAARRRRSGWVPMDPREAGRRRGLARAAALTPERRREIATAAVRARWARRKGVA